MEILTFNEFCNKYCSGLYEPRLSDEFQTNGYKTLKKMVVENIDPASLIEIDRWEKNPTMGEINSVPDIKYLRFLHPILRLYIIDNWKIIKELQIN